MDIVSIIKVVMKLSLALVPLGLLVTILVAYSTDLSYLISYLTNNPVILIMAMSMEKMLEITYIAVVFGIIMSAITTAAIFWVFT